MAAYLDIGSISTANSYHHLLTRFPPGIGMHAASRAAHKLCQRSDEPGVHMHPEGAAPIRARMCEEMEIHE